MPYYQQQSATILAEAESYYERCLSLPMYPTLTDEEQDLTIQKVKEFCG